MVDGQGAGLGVHVGQAESFVVGDDEAQGVLDGGGQEAADLLGLLSLVGLGVPRARRQPWAANASSTSSASLRSGNHHGGREWQPAGEPVRVQTHDFVGRQVGKAIPYGVYDVTADTGWVNVGCDHDTAAFTVASIRRWWQDRGADDYPRARQLLITADAGGSNGYRARAGKSELAAPAAETGLQLTVCHLPPGTSKWNRIEHRLFSHITMNWRGRPLTSHDVIVRPIATTTRTGLSVHAELDTAPTPPVSGSAMRSSP